MDKILYAITATKVLVTTVVSFQFKIESGMPRDWPLDLPFGWLKLDESETPASWLIFVFESGRGQIFTWGLPTTDEEDGKSALERLMEETPSSVILLQHDHFEQLEAACKNAGIELKAHHFDGTLQTSY